MWTPLSARGLQSVEWIQRRATKFILGFPSASFPYNERLLKLNLLPVSYWHELKDLVFLFKAVNSHYNIEITNLIDQKLMSDQQETVAASTFYFQNVKLLPSKNVIL